MDLLRPKHLEMTAVLLVAAFVVPSNTFAASGRATGNADELDVKQETPKTTNEMIDGASKDPALAPSTKKALNPQPLLPGPKHSPAMQKVNTKFGHAGFDSDLIGSGGGAGKGIRPKESAGAEVVGPAGEEIIRDRQRLVGGAPKVVPIGTGGVADAKEKSIGKAGQVIQSPRTGGQPYYYFNHEDGSHQLIKTGGANESDLKGPPMENVVDVEEGDPDHPLKTGGDTPNSRSPRAEGHSKRNLHTGSPDTDASNTSSDNGPNKP